MKKILEAVFFLALIAAVLVVFAYNADIINLHNGAMAFKTGIYSLNEQNKKELDKAVYIYNKVSRGKIFIKLELWVGSDEYDKRDEARNRIKESVSYLTNKGIPRKSINTSEAHEISSLPPMVYITIEKTIL